MKPSSLGGSLAFSMRPGYAFGYAVGCTSCPSPTFSVSLFSLPLEGKLGARHWWRVETGMWVGRAAFPSWAWTGLSSDQHITLAT